MVKSRKNNLHLEVSNDVDLEYETATTTSRRMKKGKGKGKTQTKSKKISLKAKPKSGSFLIVNGKKIPLLKSSKKSGRNKMSSKRGAKKRLPPIRNGRSLLSLERGWFFKRNLPKRQLRRQLKFLPL